MSQTYYEPFIQIGSLAGINVPELIIEPSVYFGSPLAAPQPTRSRTIHITRKSRSGGTAPLSTNHYQSFSSSLRPSSFVLRLSPFEEDFQDNFQDVLKDVLKVWRLMNVVKKEPLAYTFY
ncbi:Hypothetical_protein [Hexamita inflata]|uniref:Hypothetical_protein n=1 Tax=Hexamita inflata TaxID=28002 RepID=A0AA86PB22_9EUKA|nr:Hypothetical protein HINF_LOCUS23151 [Hexamita inflata]CAI9935515.1 Hypothetical protein HINF_LOCUS23160 [Hexamita inflata]